MKRTSATVAILLALAGCDATLPFGTIDNPDAPVAVNDLAVTNITATSATLAWTPVVSGTNAVADYLLRYGSPAITWEAANGTEVIIQGSASGSTRTYTYTGLTSGTPYQFQVVAFRDPTAQELSLGLAPLGFVAGDLSNVAQGTTLAVGPTLSPGVASASATSGQVTLSATAPTGGTTPYGYQWYKSTVGGFTPNAGNVLAGANTLGRVDTNVTNGTTYYYLLVATDAEAASVNYNQVSATPQASGALDHVAHEPGSYTRLVNRDFNSKASADTDRGSGSFPNKTGGSEGWDGAEWNDVNFTIGSDPGAPVSPSNVAQIRYPAGFSGGVAPVYLLTQGLGVTRLYFSVAFQLDPNFQGHNTTTNKFIFIKGGGGINAFVKFDGADNGPLDLRFNMQGTPDNGRNFGAGANGDMPPNTAQASSSDARAVRRGNWYILEMVVTMNTVGSANGTLDMWLGRVGQDAVPIHTHSYNNLTWRTGGADFSNVAINPTWGGTGDSVSSTMYLLVDYMYVSGL